MKRVELQPAFVLHRRSYRETSFLVELFTLEQGRVTVMARGVRKSRSATPGLLQPFVPVLAKLPAITEIEPPAGIVKLPEEVGLNTPLVNFREVVVALRAREELLKITVTPFPAAISKEKMEAGRETPVV